MDQKQLDRIKNWIGAILLLLLVIAAVKLVFNVVMMDTSLGTPRYVSESEALIRANERLVTMTQWTLSTVLIISGGLLGLNWYQNQKRYDDDRKDIEISLKEFGDRIAKVESAVDPRMDALLNNHIEALERADGPTETYGVLSTGFSMIVNAEHPRVDWTFVFLDQAIPSLIQEIQNTGVPIELDGQEAMDRFDDLCTQIEDVLPEFAPAMAFIRKWVMVIPNQ